MSMQHLAAVLSLLQRAFVARGLGYVDESDDLCREAMALLEVVSAS
jgi:hypothetical protein